MACRVVEWNLAWGSGRRIFWTGEAFWVGDRQCGYLSLFSVIWPLTAFSFLMRVCICWVDGARGRWWDGRKYCW